MSRRKERRAQERNAQGRRQRCARQESGRRRLVTTRHQFVAAVCGGAVALVACGSKQDPPRQSDRLVEQLRVFESAALAKTDFASVKGGANLGSDPYRLAALPLDHAAVIARGTDRLLVFDGSGNQVQELPVARQPSGLSLTAERLIVASMQSRELQRFAVRCADGGCALTRAAPLALPEGVTARSVVGHGEGVVHVADFHAGSLWEYRHGDWIMRDRCRGADALLRRGNSLLVSCLLEHQLRVYATGSDGALLMGPPVTISHDGPIWSFDAHAKADGELLIAASGVEDAPLDRTIGSFGNIDSFTYLYRLRHARVERLAALNVAASGLVTPKVTRFDKSGSRVHVWGYATNIRLDIDITSTPPNPSPKPILPGMSDCIARTKGWTCTNPLLDVVTTDSAVVEVPSAPRDVDERLGEALFFTTIMAPANSSEGQLSRFTCETCHFEGNVDGRTHHTGRGNVRATTKTLRGLFNNRPHFSRALDRDMSQMVHNEFRVANSNANLRDDFTLNVPSQAAFLKRMGIVADRIGPLRLRRALMRFLMAFRHEKNPNTFGRREFTELEQTGARLFERHCADCHAPRWRADDPAVAPPRDWASIIFSDRDGPVWARDTYAKTGVTPYVHERGARVPSLRRIALKYPYFTNGSAETLAQVLGRARVGGPSGEFLHDPAGHNDAHGRALAPQEARAIEAFLKLL